MNSEGGEAREMSPAIRLFIVLAIIGGISFILGIVVCEGRHKWAGGIEDIPFCKEKFEIHPKGEDL